MEIQCPHCQIAIQLVEAPLERERERVRERETLERDDVTCPSCGSQISSAERTQSEPPVVPPASNGRETTSLPASPSGLPFSVPPTSQTASASAATSLTAPQRPPVIEAFGHFQLLKRLGGGAYGDVFWAYDPQLDRDVAIKRPHQRRLPPELAERFAREARSAAQLKHRHIVGTYEVGENAWPLVPRIWLHHWLHQLVTFRVFRSQRLSF